MVGLNMVRGIGPARMRTLLNHFGSAETAWLANEGDLLASGLPKGVIENILRLRSGVDLDRVMEKLEKRAIAVRTWEDPRYPKLLRDIANPPPVIYVQGQLRNDIEWAVAVVGTRRASSYGKEAARRLSTDLARNQITVVSGLAKGIDTVAHSATLDTGGHTIAVLGCGLDYIYPPENRALAARIVEQGALISDYPLGMPPESGNFPPRNRIISGLSLGTVVVEAGQRSGALITASYALEQGREVFAVPGNIYNRGSKGTNRLIFEGAHPVSDVRDILECLNLNMVEDHQIARQILPANETEERLLQHISAEPVHADELGRQSNLPAATITSALTVMELKGMVRHVGGMKYVLARENQEPYRV
ncbi:MAG: DNA-protecting protein DprA [Chloroflexi bacterium]|nr:DNA-protecting protein DprA [Chloroflexota bacterium]